jgi:ATP/maltotriose-dependent transcriptional regulator MalT
VRLFTSAPNCTGCVGEFTMAEHAYRQASQRGRIPEPGLALLRLAQGRAAAAAAAIRRAVEEAKDLVSRSKVLPAYVEIMLATSDDAAARAAADELSGIADGMDRQYLRAVAAHAQGAVLLAEGDAWAALEALRGAWASFEELQVPYEAARLRVLAGLACQELGDEEGAELELDGPAGSSSSLARYQTSLASKRSAARRRPRLRVG